MTIVKIEKYVYLIMRSPLFNGINKDELMKILPCLNYSIKAYDKGCTVVYQGDKINSIGIIIDGSCEISKENPAGNKTIVTIMGLGNMFGESIACTQNRISPVSVSALNNVKILFVDYERIIKNCSNTCDFHSRLIGNMLKIIGEKNVLLNSKIDILVLKGMREKIATFMLNHYRLTGNNTFTINLNRNQLADYLNVCRSALSRELSRMKEQEIIDYTKSTFTIKNIEVLKNIII